MSLNIVNKLINTSVLGDPLKKEPQDPIGKIGTPSLASHTLCRESQSGHAASIKLLLRNAVIEHSR